MLSKVSQGESQLYGVGLPDRDSERVVEPRPQVAVCQQVEAQHGRQVGETPPPRRLHLHELQEQDRDQCCPNLRLDRVLAGAHEGLDLEVLLDCLEKELDLPTVPVDAADGGRGECPLVGEQDDLPLVLRVPDADTPQDAAATLGGGPGQADPLLASERSAAAGNAVDDLVLGVSLHAGDEVDAGGVPAAEHPVVVVGTVHHDDGARVEREALSHAHVVRAALGDQRPAGQAAPVLKLQVQLDRALGPAVLRPVENLQAKVDRRGVYHPQRVLEPEGSPPLGRQTLAPPEQLLEDALVELPRPVRVRIGQRRALRRLLQPQVHHLAQRRAQPAADLTQRVRRTQLAEQHRHELVPTAETLSPALRIQFPHRTVESVSVNHRQHLRKAARHAYHNHASVVVSAASTAGMSFLVHPSYTFSGGLSFQNAILDKSGFNYLKFIKLTIIMMNALRVYHTIQE